MRLSRIAKLMGKRCRLKQPTPHWKILTVEILLTELYDKPNKRVMLNIARGMALDDETWNDELEGVFQRVRSRLSEPSAP